MSGSWIIVEKHCCKSAAFGIVWYCQSSRQVKPRNRSTYGNLLKVTFWLIEERVAYLINGSRQFI